MSVARTFETENTHTHTRFHSHIKRKEEQLKMRDFDGNNDDDDAHISTPCSRARSAWLARPGSSVVSLKESFLSGGEQ